MTAFKQVLTNLQQGQREEAMIGLEFVLRLDPAFVPATNLKRQLGTSSDEIDLGDIIAQLQAPTTDAINTLLIEAVDDFNTRDFLAAKHKVEQVLIDLPGHQEARDLRDQVDKALKIENQVGQFLIQAREALGKGDPQEAANFVMMAQALDPHHTGIATTLKEIDETGGLAFAQDAPGAPVQPQPLDSAPAGPPTRTATPGDSTSPGGVPPMDAGPPPQAAAPPEAPDDEDAFAVEFDTADPFADFIDQSPESTTLESTAPEPEPGMGGFDDAPTSFPPMDDTADLFTAPSERPNLGDVGSSAVDPALFPDLGGAQDAGFPAAADQDDGSMAATIRELIERGEAASTGGDPARAISLWSRVFLMKPTHPEAGHLIEQAKKRLAATEVEIGDVLTKTRAAINDREFETASLLLDKAQALRPGHLESARLREELDRLDGASAAKAPAAPPSRPTESAIPELPDLDDDLFGDLPDLADDGMSGTEVDRGFDDDLFEDDGGLDDFEPSTLVERIKTKLSLGTAMIAVVALVVVLAGGWMGSRFLSSGPDVDESAKVNEVLVEADRLYKEHKVEEAIHLLREFPASGLFKQRIDMRISKYEESSAAPTPSPVPEHTTQAEKLLGQGLWWAAFSSARAGLAEHPDNERLLEIRQQVIDLEPDAEALEHAVRSNDHRVAVSISEELFQHYRDQGDLKVVLERSLFNAALAEARAYNLTGAENHLVRLLELKPSDEEADRFLEFVQKYKVRAADMRLEIFIRSLAER